MNDHDSYVLLKFSCGKKCSEVAKNVMISSSYYSLISIYVVDWAVVAE